MPFRKFARSKPAARTRSLFEDETALAKASSRPQHFLTAYIDGGARGNPGPAGLGAVIEDQDRRRLAELSEYLGHQTNNFAEYSALLAVLEYAMKQGARALQVVSDSELLVKQIRGEYKVKAPGLRDLHERALGLMRKLEWFRIEHVPRGRNRDADRLANEAMDSGTRELNGPQ